MTRYQMRQRALEARLQRLELSGSRVTILGTIAGLADSLQILGYPSGIDPSYFSAVAIGIKLILLPLCDYRNLNRNGLLFLLILGVLLFVSITASPYKDMNAVLKTIPVLISIAMTLVVTSNRDALTAYGKAVVDFTALASLIYLVMVLQGAIENHWGRYSYFGGAHPNLGCEIGCAALILACIFYRNWAFLIRLPVLFAPLFLMQGRSSIVAGALAVGIHGLYGFRRHYRRSPVLVILAAAVVIPLAIYLLFDSVVATINAVLLLDDPNRGVGTGFVGRDDRWSSAIELIRQRPFLGYGPGIYDDESVASSHNFFLYGFVNLGIMFFIVLGFYIFFAVRAFNRVPKWTVILSSMVVLMLFNDRFLNFAPYPFQLYVMLLSFAAQPLAAARQELHRAGLKPPPLPSHPAGSSRSLSRQP